MTIINLFIFNSTFAVFNITVEFCSKDNNCQSVYIDFLISWFNLKTFFCTKDLLFLEILSYQLFIFSFIILPLLLFHFSKNYHYNKYRKNKKKRNDRAFERQSVSTKVIYFLHFLAQFSNFFS